MLQLRPISAFIFFPRPANSLLFEFKAMRNEALCDKYFIYPNDILWDSVAPACCGFAALGGSLPSLHARHLDEAPFFRTDNSLPFLCHLGKRFLPGKAAFLKVGSLCIESNRGKVGQVAAGPSEEGLSVLHFFLASLQQMH